MRTLGLALMALSLFTSTGSAQEDWRAFLQKDLVEVQGDLIVWDHFVLERLEFAGAEPIQFQVKYHSEAPAEGVMSRDMFVALSTEANTILLFGILSEAYQVSFSDFLDAYDSEPLDAPIGTPDLELNLVMTGEGVQFEIVNTATGERTRETTTWTDIFEGQ